MRSRALVSWSGGKDCCLAAHRARAEHDLVGLVSMLTDDGSRSRSHGLRPEILHAQAKAFDLPLLTANASWESYEQTFTRLLTSAARQYGATHAVFGDVFPDANREWAERVSSAAGLVAVEPLWAEPTSDLVNQFITLGVKRSSLLSATPCSTRPGWGNTSIERL